MPLRSSRHTRNAEHNTPARNRAGVIDYDPTDGLPVRKYVLESVRVNQDTAAAGLDDLDPDRAGKSALDKDDGTYYPWPDLALPSFFDQLPQHNQELIRRARRGDRSAKLSVWDPKAKGDGGEGEWVKWEKARGLGLVGTVMKSRHLMNVSDAGEVEENEAEDEEELEDDDGDGDETAIADGIHAGVTGGVAKKRKVEANVSAQSEERIFEVRRWVAVPVDKADKMSDPKYLADTRPGMSNIYTNVEVLKQAGGYGAPITTVNEYSGFDLGDGSGLGTALGGGPAAPGEATPARRNMPPKRKKKKKLGGPGRRKAVPVEPTEQHAGATEAREGETVEKKEEEKKEDGMEIEGDEGEGSGDDSEGEGSEEGEVNEEAPPAPPAPAPAPAPAPIPAPALPAPVPAPVSEPVSAPVSEPGPAPASEPVPAPASEPVPAPASEPVPAPASEPAPAPAPVPVPAPPAEEPKVTVEAPASEQKEEPDLLGGLEAALAKEGDA